MTSMYAAATPVAAKAIAPTRPPGREYSRAATPMSAPASTAPAPTRISGRRMPACAASTRSSTTPMSVTATPATARILPIQLASRGGRGADGGCVSRGGGAMGGAGGGGQCGAGGGAYAAASGGYGCGAGIGGGTGCGAACGTDGRSDSSRSSSLRSAETLASCWDIAAKSAESRVTTAWSGAVMPVWSQRSDGRRMSRTTQFRYSSRPCSIA